MTVPELVFWWLLVFVGIGGSAMCSGLEVGLYTVNRVIVRVRAADKKQGVRARILESQIDNQNSTLTALLIWNNIFNYAGTLAFTTLIATQGFGDTEMILIQIVILTPVLLVFAESTPKEVFRAHADILMERFAHVIKLMSGSLTWVPLVPAVLFIANTMSKLVGIDSLGSLASARQHMGELLKFGSHQMSDAQVSLIDRALELEHASVRSEMIPLRNAVVIRESWNIGKAKSVIRNHPYARFPVLSTKGQVVGVLAGIDLYLQTTSDDSTSIKDLIEQPVRVNATSTVRAALVKIGRSSARLGIVVADGHDVGIVTRKNLIEPLVGELKDW